MNPDWFPSTAEHSKHGASYPVMPQLSLQVRKLVRSYSPHEVAPALAGPQPEP
jgi:hypothetical protein